MPVKSDWSEKIKEVVERVTTRYEYIGRKTGAPFLAVVYPPEKEALVFKEFETLMDVHADEFDVRYIDVLKVTMEVIEDIGCEHIVNTLEDPMPGSDPEVELGKMWVYAVVKAVKEISKSDSQKKPLLVLKRLAALYPVASPKMVMQELWDCNQSYLEGPVVVLIPGSIPGTRIAGSRAYDFLGKKRELMYRGDIL